MIIPDAVRSSLFRQPDRRTGDEPGGAVLTCGLIFHVFVVVVGVLMLAGAVNTAIVGSNGVLNRVSEDGILPDWFRHPHRRFGTSYRILNLVVGLQMLTIVLSRGDIFVLGEAYAFGVMWSFAMKGLAVLVLRYKQPGDREFRVPLNFKIGDTEIPVGLALITLTLVRAVHHQSVHQTGGDDLRGRFHARLFRRFRDFRKDHQETQPRRTPSWTNSILSQASRSDARKRGRAARQHPGAGEHLLRAVSSGSGAAARQTREAEIVVLHVRLLRRAASGEYDLAPDQLFSTIEQMLFTKVLGDGGKRRQASAAGGGGGKRSVGRHSAHGGESGIEHDRARQLREDAHHRTGPRDRASPGNACRSRGRE